MPTKRIDKRRDEATASHEAIDFEICQISSEQCRAAKNTNNKNTKQEAAMQINPHYHDCRQQKYALSSFQTFPVEYCRKQHRGKIWRSGEVNIGIRRKS